MLVIYREGRWTVEGFVYAAVVNGATPMLVPSFVWKEAVTDRAVDGFSAVPLSATTSLHGADEGAPAVVDEAAQ